MTGKGKKFHSPSIPIEKMTFHPFPAAGHKYNCTPNPWPPGAPQLYPGWVGWQG